MKILTWGSLFLVLFWCLKVFQKIWLRPKMIEKKLRKQGIHVLPYKPPYGNVKEIIRLASEAKSQPMQQLSHDIAPRLNPLLYQLHLTYKKPFVIWYGMVPRVTIMDPKLAKEILTRKYEFRKLDIGPTFKLFLKGLANIEGDQWQQHRKLINPAFHIEKLKGMLPSFIESCEEMIEKWKNLVESANDGVELDVFTEFQDLTADIISRAAFGSNIEEGRMIFSLQRKQAELFFQSLFSFNSILSKNSLLARFMPSKITKQMKQIHGEVRTLLLGLIENREKAILSGNAGQDDLLNLLLKSNLEEVQENKNIGMSKEDVIEECKLFYFAGHETTANLLTWTMIALSIHMDWQEKARKEISQLLGKNQPTFEDLNRLRTVNAILYEVLRLYPPTSLVRAIYEETKLGEYIFPAGVSFEIPLYILHRDLELWGSDAMEFNPKRFFDGNTNPFFTFGWGPRVCIGQNFAMLEAKLALIFILQHFLFELSPTYKHAPNVILTLQPQFGAQIILHKI